jgi:hypothetical protein
LQLRVACLLAAGRNTGGMMNYPGLKKLQESKEERKNIAVAIPASPNRPAVNNGRFLNLKKSNFMARQDSIINLRGRIGNIVFFKKKSGEYGARSYSPFEPGTVEKDKRFLRTQQNMAEFKRAVKANKTLRTAFTEPLQRITDSRLMGRMNSQMLSVLRADASNPRGQRNVMEGNLQLLRGFDFNANSALDPTLKVQPTCTIDRATGQLKVVLPSFIPVFFVKAPYEASAIKIVSAGAEIDFEQEAYVSQTVKSDMINLDETPTQLITLTTNVPANSSHTLFLLLGVEFYQQTPNGDLNLLKAGAFTSLKIVEISKA